MIDDLFATPDAAQPWSEPVDTGATVLRGFALAPAAALLAAINAISAAAPFRHMTTPGGQAMSAAMTNCGALGWISDARGYRYAPADPLTGRPWPQLPDAWLRLAAGAADVAGFPGFVPDACLINRYAPGARMALHQDRDERDLTQPIVSVSLGLSVIFQFGGLQRAQRPQRVPLMHGDVMVWGGPARLRYHGVLALRGGLHPLVGGYRINLTFRKAG